MAKQQQVVDTSNKMDDVDVGVVVVVIGAGISGLATATELVKQHGYHVILIEAQEKVGGRMRSNGDIKSLKTTTTTTTTIEKRNEHGNTANDTAATTTTTKDENNSKCTFVFDEGASWIHGIHNNPITELGTVSNMKTIRMNDGWDTITYDIDGIQYEKSVYKSAENYLYDSILPNMYKQYGNYESSFEEIFRQIYLPKLIQSSHRKNKKQNKNKNNNTNKVIQTTTATATASNDEQQIQRLWNFLVSSFVQFDCGDINQLSSKNYWQGEEYRGGETFVINGYETIPQYLLQQFMLHTSSAVSAVSSSVSSVSSQRSQLLLNTKVVKLDSLAIPDKVQVHIEPSSTTSLTFDSSSSGTPGSRSTIIVADYVVVTVPLGVLQANTLEFVPTLPKWKQTAIDTIGMNCVNKYLLLFDTVFWDVNVQYIYYTPSCNKHQNKDKYNYFVNVTKIDPSINALVTFAYADAARQSEYQTDEEVINEIMYNLRDMYGGGTNNQSIPDPIQLVRTKWNTNPYTYGSYSYYKKTTKPGHYYDMSRPICNDTIYFAGEHTNVQYFSTTHGAYLSGIREAQNIIETVNERKETK